MGRRKGLSPFQEAPTLDIMLQTVLVSLLPVQPESTILFRTVHYSTVQYSTVQYSTLLYSSVQYCTVQYITVQFSTVLYSSVQYCTVHSCLSCLREQSFSVLFCTVYNMYYCFYITFFFSDLKFDRTI